jgi:hypothetical protein
MRFIDDAGDRYLNNKEGSMPNLHDVIIYDQSDMVVKK